MTLIRTAFLGLTDAAVLVAAREMGFAQGEGIALELVRDTSWATLRDRLVYGQVQAAQMLAPLAVAVTLGLSQQPCSLSVPYKLNVNGNLIVMSPEFAAALEPDTDRRLGDPLAAAHDFAAAIGLHHRKPIIGVVHRFSSHALILRYWLASAGIDPDKDVVLRVLPPSLMVEAMHAREIDGFTAGEPWGSAAIEAGLAEAVAASERLWQRGVEKVLTFRTDWMESNPEAVDATIRALAQAASWCDDAANRAELAQLLSHPAYVDQPADLIERALAGRIVARRGETPVDCPDFVLFGREATPFPWQSQALWIYSQLARWHMVEARHDSQVQATAVFRPDIYRRALADSDVAMPGASMKVEGALGAPLAIGAPKGSITLGPDRFFDGRAFDPDRLEEYIGSFQVSR